MDGRDLYDRRPDRKSQVEPILTSCGESTPIRSIRYQPDDHLDVKDHGQDCFAFVKNLLVRWVCVDVACGLEDERSQGERDEAPPYVLVEILDFTSFDDSPSIYVRPTLLPVLNSRTKSREG